MIVCAFLLTGCGGNSPTRQAPVDYAPPSQSLSIESYDRLLRAMQQAKQADPSVTAFGDAPDWQSDELQFLKYVAADINAFWPTVFAGSSDSYVKPQLQYATSDGQVDSACGSIPTQNGWFYCQYDSTVYYVPFNMLNEKIRPTGKMGLAVIIAHEYGHHVQNLLGISSAVLAERAQYAKGSAESNRLSRLQELQADCFAGVWTHHKVAQGQLAQADIYSAILALAFIGDDVLGTKEREKQDHGNLEERMGWFDVGFHSGDISQCKTFLNDGSPPQVAGQAQQDPPASTRDPITEFFANSTADSCLVTDDKSADTTKTIRCSFSDNGQSVVVDYDSWSSMTEIATYLAVPADKALYTGTWKGPSGSPYSGNIAAYNSSQGLVVIWDVEGKPLTGTIYWYDANTDAAIKWFETYGSRTNP
jgi:predicted metalloprotease